MATPFFAIVIDGASPAQLNEAHSIIKKQANGWWHRMANFWIAGGHTATEWRDYLSPVVTGGPTALVLKLPGAEAERAWAMRGRDVAEKADWLKKSYRKTTSLP